MSAEIVTNDDRLTSACTGCGEDDHVTRRVFFLKRMINFSTSSVYRVDFFAQVLIFALFFLDTMCTRNNFIRYFFPYRSEVTAVCVSLFLSVSAYSDKKSKSR